MTEDGKSKGKAGKVITQCLGHNSYTIIVCLKVLKRCTANFDHTKIPVDCIRQEKVHLKKKQNI